MTSRTILRRIAMVASRCSAVLLLASSCWLVKLLAQAADPSATRRAGADAALARGDVNEALKQWQLNLVAAEQSGSLDRLGTGQIELAAIYTLRWEFAEASAAVQSAEAAGIAKDPAMQFRADSVEAQFEAATSDFGAARMHLNDAINLAKTSLALGDDHPKTAALYSLLGLVELGNERLEDSSGALTRAAGVLNETYGPDYLESAIARDRYARLLLATGRWNDALQQAAGAIEVARKLGPSTRIELSEALLTHGLINLAAHRYAAAADNLQESLQLTQAIFGGGLRTVPILTALAEVALGRGDAAQSSSLISQALDVYNRNPPLNWIPAVDALRAAARVAAREGRAADAAGLLDRALQIASARLGPDSLLAARVVETRADLALDAGDLTGAEADYRKVLDARQKILTPGNPDVARGATNLALVAARRGSPSVSLEMTYTAAISNITSESGADSLGLIPTLERYATFLRNQKRDQDAAEVDKRIQRIMNSGS